MSQKADTNYQYTYCEYVWLAVVWRSSLACAINTMLSAIMLGRHFKIWVHCWTNSQSSDNALMSSDFGSSVNDDDDDDLYTTVPDEDDDDIYGNVIGLKTEKVHFSCLLFIISFIDAISI